MLRQKRYILYSDRETLTRYFKILSPKSYVDIDHLAYDCFENILHCHYINCVTVTK